MKSPAILIAEGDEILRQDLKGRLFRHGFDVIEVTDRTDVLQFFLDRKPDLVIIGSSRNSTCDELKLAEQIRKRDKTVPLILTTRHSSEALVTAALRAGVSDYFKIPFSHRDGSTGGKIRGEQSRKDCPLFLIGLPVHLTLRRPLVTNPASLSIRSRKS